MPGRPTAPQACRPRLIVFVAEVARLRAFMPPRPEFCANSATSSVAMDRLRRKGRHADGDVLGPLRTRRAVLHPFPLRRDDGLTGGHIDDSGFRGDTQRAAEDERVLVE